MNKIYCMVIAITLVLFSVVGCSKKSDAPLPTSKLITQPQASAVEIKNVVQDNSGKTVLYWYDPMVADKHFEKPGKSPFMDMQLLPKYANDLDKGGQP